MRFFPLVLLLSALMVPGLPAAPAGAAEEISFGIMSTESSQNLRQIWEPFLADMEARTGLKIRPFFASDYAGIVEAMRFGKVQLAWIGNKAAMEAVDRAGGEVFMQVIYKDGSEGYYSHLIVHKGSPLSSLEDVLKNAADLTFGNGDPNSTSGFLVPSYYVFALNGVDSKKAFKRSVNANHEANALSVANKQVDVATNNSENLDRLELTAPDKRALIKVIWTSPLIASDPIVRRADLDPKVKAAIEKFFLEYGRIGDEQQRIHDRDIMEPMQWSGFKKSDNNQLIPIRQLELFKSKSKVENDEKMPAAEKTAALAEIDRKLEELSKLAPAGK